MAVLWCDLSHVVNVCTQQMCRSCSVEGKVLSHRESASKFQYLCNSLSLSLDHLCTGLVAAHRSGEGRVHTHPSPTSALVLLQHTGVVRGVSTLTPLPPPHWSLSMTDYQSWQDLSFLLDSCSSVISVAGTLISAYSFPPLIGCVCF